MTKSFTAATILLLRDDGRLRLDDPVADLGARAGRPWRRDRATRRRSRSAHLLTMSAGLPTDDPWGDRQQDMPPTRSPRCFAEVSPLAWPPGRGSSTPTSASRSSGASSTRAAGAVPGRRPSAVPRAARPRRPGFDETTSTGAASRSATSRRDDCGRAADRPRMARSAPMGGLFTSVRDLARWVGWFADAFPARDDPDAATAVPGDPARDAAGPSDDAAELRWPPPRRAPAARRGGYGFGLFVDLDVTRGRIVGHGGGYPGMGRRWAGIRRAGSASSASRMALCAGWAIRAARPSSPVDREAAPARRPPSVAGRSIEARAAVERLLDRWDDSVADAAVRDERRSRRGLRARGAPRSRRCARSTAVSGPIRPSRRVLVGAADIAWWLAGDRGRVKVEILLDAERPPLVQWLEITSVPGPAGEPDGDRRTDRRAPRDPEPGVAGRPDARCGNRSPGRRARAAGDRGGVRSHRARPGHGR